MPSRHCPLQDAGLLVSTRFEPAESCVFLAVEDEGIGIPPEHQARLCDPFFTTKHESGGTGLGLAITSTLVRAHGGRLTFSSEPGRGTRALVMPPCLNKWSPLQCVNRPLAVIVPPCLVISSGFRRLEIPAMLHYRCSFIFLPVSIPATVSWSLFFSSFVNSATVCLL